MEEMFEFRLHGRGGQGIVVAASIFAEAVFLDGYYARAFSLFGAERRGAPVTAFIRAGKNRLMPRSRIYNPDYIVVFDSSLNMDTSMAGLKEGGTLLINSGEDDSGNLVINTGMDANFKIYTVNATGIAWKHKLAVGSFPMVNTVMLGAMGAISGLASLDSLVTSIKKRVTAKLDANISAAAEGYDSVKEVEHLVT